MKNSRRDFIKASVLGSAAILAGAPVRGQANESQIAGGRLEFLVLGGTKFIGPHMVRDALRRGHSVTLFNRGRTNPRLFPDLETIKGDRDGGLTGLAGRSWDVVVDNSGYVPRHVQDSARLLADRIGRYIYVSSASVYADFNDHNTEDSALARIADESVEKVTGATYGALKALCEKRAAAEISPERRSLSRSSRPAQSACQRQ